MTIKFSIKLSFATIEIQVTVADNIGFAVDVKPVTEGIKLSEN